MTVSTANRTRHVDRWLPLAAAGVVAMYAITRGRRGARGRPGDGSDTRTQLGGSRGLHVEQAVTIARPVADVYRFWRRLENLPAFMRHLEQVVERADGVSHWVGKGPAGRTVEWDAQIINDVVNKVIGWQSLPGSTVATAGAVNFRETPHGTAVHVHFQYNPPGGRAGAWVAWLLGEDPARQVRDDLRRLKQLLETGEIATIAGQSSGRARATGEAR